MSIRVHIHIHFHIHTLLVLIDMIDKTCIRYCHSSILVHVRQHQAPSMIGTPEAVDGAARSIRVFVIVTRFMAPA
jgi:hypothetical protein